MITFPVILNGPVSVSSLPSFELAAPHLEDLCLLVLGLPDVGAVSCPPERDQSVPLRTACRSLPESRVERFGILVEAHHDVLPVLLDLPQVVGETEGLSLQPGRSEQLYLVPADLALHLLHAVVEAHPADPDHQREGARLCLHGAADGALGWRLRGVLQREGRIRAIRFKAAPRLSGLE